MCWLNGYYFLYFIDLIFVDDSISSFGQEMAPFFCAAENMRDACLSPRERAPSGWLSSPLWFIPCFWLWTCIFDCDPQGGSGGSLLSPRRLPKIRVCPEGFGRSLFSLAAMP